MPAAKNSRVRPAILLALRWIGPMTIRETAQACSSLVTRCSETRIRSTMNELRIDGLVRRDGDTYVRR